MHIAYKEHNVYSHLDLSLFRYIYENEPRKIKSYPGFLQESRRPKERVS